MRKLQPAIAALLIFPTASATAACLLSDYSVPAERVRAELVVSGVVISWATAVSPDDEPDGTFYTVEVDREFKGQAPAVVVVYSENSSARFPMKFKHRYLLFLGKSGDRFVADNCGNSGPFGRRRSVLSELASGR